MSTPGVTLRASESPEDGPTCCWPLCVYPTIFGSELCFLHLSLAAKILEENRRPSPVPTAEQRAAVYAEQSLVYYVAQRDDTVKIGTTVNLVQRLSSLRLPREAVLATEPGGRDLEQVRHKQFAAIKHGRREDFDRSPELMSHIDMLIAHYGPPTITGYVHVPWNRT